MEKPINESEIKNTPMKRAFIIGDEWLYYKFYTGPKTADLILTELIKPTAELFLSNNMIDRWFFIRYADPKIHTRLRFHITDPQYTGTIINEMRDAITPFIEQSLIYKIQIDTYEREVERYGLLTMELTEKYFFHDSRMIVDMLSLIEGDEGERIRWLFGLRIIDTMLDDFQFTMEQKYELVTMLREGFGREFNMNKSLKDQLERKFRNDRAQIDEILNRKNDEVSEIFQLFELINQKSQNVQPLTQELLELQKSNRLEMKLNDLLGSYSHMMINRLFKSKQRLHELALYDFLHRYYKSEIARQKYSASNELKKEKKEKIKEEAVKN